MLFRQTHPAYAFIWEDADQPAGRWHATGDEPVHYFATTADGAWAELLRHEEITEPEDLAGIRERAMWIVGLNDPDLSSPVLEETLLTGGPQSYPPCQREARRLRQAGSTGLRAPSAALVTNSARMYYVDEGQHFEVVPNEVVALFGERPDLRAQLSAIGRPDPSILQRIRRL